MRKKVKAGKPKGRSSKFKSVNSYAVEEKKPSKDVFNRADNALQNLTNNKGIPRKKVGLK